MKAYVLDAKGRSGALANMIKNISTCVLDAQKGSITLEKAYKSLGFDRENKPKSPINFFKGAPNSELGHRHDGFELVMVGFNVVWWVLGR